MTKGSDNDIILSPRLQELAEEYGKDPESTKFLPLSEEYRRSRMFEEAIYIAQEGLKLHPNLTPAKITLARCYHEIGEREGALNLLDEVLETQPQNIASLRLRGEIMTELGDIDAARSCFETVLKINPSDMVAQNKIKDINRLESVGPETGRFITHGGEVNLSEFEEEPEIEISGTRKTDTKDELESAEPSAESKIIPEEKVPDLDLELEHTDEIVEMELSVEEGDDRPQITISGFENIQEVTLSSEAEEKEILGNSQSDPLSDDQDRRPLAPVPFSEEDDVKEEEEDLVTGRYETLPQDDAYIPEIGSKPEATNINKGDLTREFEDIIFGDEDKLDISTMRTVARPDFETKKPKDDDFRFDDDKPLDSDEENITEEDFTEVGKLEDLELDIEDENQDDLEETSDLIITDDDNEELEIESESGVNEVFADNDDEDVELISVKHSESTVEMPEFKDKIEPEEDIVFTDDTEEKDESEIFEGGSYQDAGESLRINASDVDFIDSDNLDTSENIEDSDGEEISVDEIEVNKGSDNIFAGLSDNDEDDEEGEEASEIIIDSDEEIDVDGDDEENEEPDIFEGFAESSKSELEISVDDEIKFDDTLILKEEMKSDGLQDKRESDDELLMVPEYEEHEEEKSIVSDKGEDTLIRERPEWAISGEEIVLEEKDTPITFELDKPEEGEEIYQVEEKDTEDAGIFDSEDIFETETDEDDLFLPATEIVEDHKESTEEKIQNDMSEDDSDLALKIQEENSLELFGEETEKDEVLKENQAESEERPEIEEPDDIFILDKEEIAFAADDVKNESSDEELTESTDHSEEKFALDHSEQVSVENESEEKEEVVVADNFEEELLLDNPDTVFEEEEAVFEEKTTEKIPPDEELFLVNDDDENEEDNLVKVVTIDSDHEKLEDIEDVFDEIESTIKAVEKSVEEVESLANEDESLQALLSDKDAMDIKENVVPGDDIFSEEETEAPEAAFLDDDEDYEEDSESMVFVEDEAFEVSVEESIEETIEDVIEVEAIPASITSTAIEDDMINIDLPDDQASSKYEFDVDMDSINVKLPGQKENEIVIEDVKVVGANLETSKEFDVFIESDDLVQVKDIEEKSSVAEIVTATPSEEIVDDNVIADAEEDDDDEFVLDNSMVASDSVIDKAEIFVEYDSPDDDEDDELELGSAMIVGDTPLSDYLEDVEILHVGDQDDEEYEDLDLDDEYILEKGIAEGEQYSSEIQSEVFVESIDQDIAADQEEELVLERKKPSIEEIAASLKEKLSEEKPPPAIVKPSAAEQAKIIEEEDELIPLTVSTAKVYEKQGHYEKALDIYRKIVIKDTENHEARDKIKKLESKLGMRKEFSEISGGEKVAILESWLQNIREFKRTHKIG